LEVPGFSVMARTLTILTGFCGFFFSLPPHILIQYLQLHYYHFLPHPLHFTVPLVPTACTLLFILFQSTVLICTLLFFLSRALWVSWSCFINTYLFNLLAVESFFQNDYCNSCWLTVLNSCTVTLNITVWHILHNILRVQSTSIFM
jgi:hypothetical protein